MLTSTNRNSAGSRNDFSLLPDQSFIQTQILLTHATRSETIFELLATRGAVNPTNLSNGLNRSIRIGNDESRQPLLDYLRHRTVRIGNHRCTAGKRFNHHDSE